MSFHVEGVLTGEDHVSLEKLLLLLDDVLTVWLHVLLDKAKINDSDLVKRVSNLSEVWGIADEDVVELKVVEGVTCFMDHLEGINELDAGLEYSLLGEWLVLLEQVVLEGVT